MTARTRSHPLTSVMPSYELELHRLEESQKRDLQLFQRMEDAMADRHRRELDHLSFLKSFCPSWQAPSTKAHEHPVYYAPPRVNGRKGSLGERSVLNPLLPRGYTGGQHSSLREVNQNVSRSTPSKPAWQHSWPGRRPDLTPTSGLMWRNLEQLERGIES